MAIWPRRAFVISHRGNFDGTELIAELNFWSIKKPYIFTSIRSIVHDRSSASTIAD